MPISRFKPRRETLWPFVLAGTITLCSGYPAAVPEVTWFEPDKLGHFAAYGALATAIIRHPAVGRLRLVAPWLALLLASAYGMGDEFRQSLTGFRTFDLADWVADTAGALVAVVLYTLWPWYRRTMETKLGSKRPKPRVEISDGPVPNFPS